MDSCSFAPLVEPSNHESSAMDLVVCLHDDPGDTPIRASSLEALQGFAKKGRLAKAEKYHLHGGLGDRPHGSYRSDEASAAQLSKSRSGARVALLGVRTTMR